MEFRFRTDVVKPCACCNAEELTILKRAQADSEDQHWIYHLKADNRCPGCVVTYTWSEVFERAAIFVLLSYYIACNVDYIYHPYITHRVIILAKWYFFYRSYLSPKKKSVWVKIPISVKTVGTVERAIHAASVAAKGAEYRAHGTFIHHLSLLDIDEVLKQALCTWAPSAMMGFRKMKGATRVLTAGHPVVCTEPSETTTTHEGNPDLNGGDMPGTRLNGDEYLDEEMPKDDRIKMQDAEEDDKILGIRIGPDLIPTEVMASTEKNLKAGLSKRVRPLEFRASKKMIRKIEKCVDSLIKEVFTEDAIKDWREQNPCFDDFKSKKWSGDRWRQAVIDALSDTHAKIEQEFQIKTNEALPAKGKAPRPIIQCGDKAQVMMQLPVKCFEDLLFHHFEDASIKHVSKYDAMCRVAGHLKHITTSTTFNGGIEGKLNLIEGDGSAWDACCNKKIRGMTENRIIQHIIEVLGDDPEVPRCWMDNTLKDMEKSKIKGKAKVDGKKLVPPIRVAIESIRQSGHRGTSCFNYLINLVGWLCVLTDNPEDLIKKVLNAKKGKKTLPMRYVSAVDGNMYNLKYAFEGDDSALSTNEKLNPEYIEKEWKSMGFRMKLVFVKDKMTFTGFDFACDERGPTGKFVPEIPRNIASSSWSCSALLKQDPSKRHEIGMAAYYARAENFKDCGPLCKYFAEIGLAHARLTSDRGIDDAEAVSLGVNATNSIVSQLQLLAENADVMDGPMRKLVQKVVPDWSEYYELGLLSCSFGDNPMNTDLARSLLPKSLWDPSKYQQARR